MKALSPLIIIPAIMIASVGCASSAKSPSPNPSPSVKEVAHPVIGQVAGQAVAVIQTPQGNRDPAIGMALLPGYVIRTGIRAAVKIQYPDGVLVIAGGKSDFILKADQGRDHFIGLKRGIIRVLSSGDQAIHVQTRFGELTLPVRAYGMDAVIEIRFKKDDEDPKIQFWEGSAHALTGVIKIEDGPVVANSHFTQLREGKNPTKPLSFDRMAFSKILEGQHPDMQKLAPEIPPIPRVEVEMIPKRPEQK